MRKRFLVAVVLATINVTGWAQQIGLVPLEQITWSVTESIGKGPGVPIGLSLQATGRRIDANFRSVNISKEAAYSDALSCCIAAIRARIEMDEAWWGNLAAEKKDRDASGEPLSGYVADSERNLYKMFTFHTQDAKAPQVVDAQIHTYLRIGGMHAFDVEWTRVVGQDKGPSASSVVAVQEFSPGLYRLATEWMGPQEPIVPFLRDVNGEDVSIAARRESNPELNYELSIHKLFGGEGDSFPLILKFRGAKSGQLDKFDRLKGRKQDIVAEVKLRTDRAKSAGGPVDEGGLAKFLTPESLEMYKKQGSATQMQAPFVADTAFVIDAGEVLFVFGRDPQSGTLSKRVTTFQEKQGELLLANYAKDTLLKNFLIDDRIWKPLSEKMEQALAEVKK